jgi:hypothetical protein
VGSGPNKTVEKAAKRRAFDPTRQAEKDEARARRMQSDEFMQWMFAQASAGRTFASMEEARSAFESK